MDVLIDPELERAPARGRRRRSGDAGCVGTAQRPHPDGSADPCPDVEVVFAAAPGSHPAWAASGDPSSTPRADRSDPGRSGCIRSIPPPAPTFPTPPFQ